jgi:SAM-dependent methyltransferase
MVREKNVKQFDADVASNKGYLYTKTDKLSSATAATRIAECVASMYDFKGKRVLDMGCGDGTYSSQYLDLGAKEVVGVDAAAKAIQAAKRTHRGRKNIRFEVLDIYNARPPKRRYDVMVIRGVLHHLYNVEEAIAAMPPMAHTTIVVEPNGYNPILKVIERTSKYHIEHEEKSYPPHRLDAWFKKEGGRIVETRYIGLVPVFWPDGGVPFLKMIEPFVEWMPGLKQISCAQYVQKIEMP